jgi:8-oxo-dGTP pyrophosphatase MutT (NUDIX family)
MLASSEKHSSFIEEHMANKVSYIGTKAIIRKDGKILITQEPLNFVGGGKWELPGGKLDEKEAYGPLEDALMREIKEELGATFRVNVGPLFGVIRRPWNKPGASADMVFLATYLCDHVQGEIVLSDENHAFKWIGRDELHAQEFVPGYLPVLESFFNKNL